MRTPPELERGAPLKTGSGIIRSVVFVPAHDADVILRAADMGMDALCLDLEDLTPASGKSAARDLWPAIGVELKTRGIVVFARVNGLHTGQTVADLEAICCSELDCVNLPKAESAADIEHFTKLLASVEVDKGLKAGRILVRPVIETAAGIRSAFEIAAASSLVEYMGGVCGGEYGDLGASLGLRALPDSRESLYLRSKVLVDVRAAGVRWPIGGGTPPTDVEGIRAFARENRALGYEGVQCANRPDYIEAVHDVFTPSSAEVERWSELLPLLDQAERAGETVVELPGGPRIDVTVGARVRDRLQLAQRLGLT
jgi:citrate lyase subunit beta/citryl-CoA lyase